MICYAVRGAVAVMQGFNVLRGFGVGTNVAPILVSMIICIGGGHHLKAFGACPTGAIARLQSAADPVALLISFAGSLAGLEADGAHIFPFC
jgi:hypothetical protein